MMIISSLKEEPRNTQQLSDVLKMDYTTVRHHLRILESNRLVTTAGERYGKVYFLSEAMEEHWKVLESTIKRIRLRERAGTTT